MANKYVWSKQWGSAHYDAFNEKDSEATNCLIESMLKKHKVKSVLDLTCGTGSQK